MRPSLQTIVISCFDPRVDPAAILGAQPGEIGVLRNIGGRVTPHLSHELAALKQIARNVGSDLGPGWEIIILQHTDCGITRISDRPDLLAPYFEVDRDQASTLAITDPHIATAHDVATLSADDRFSGVTVTGVVYDVATGLVTEVDTLNR